MVFYESLVSQPTTLHSMNQNMELVSFFDTVCIVRRIHHSLSRDGDHFCPDGIRMFLLGLKPGSTAHIRILSSLSNKSGSSD